MDEIRIKTETMTDEAKEVITEVVVASVGALISGLLRNL